MLLNCDRESRTRRVLCEKNDMLKSENCTALSIGRLNVRGDELRGSSAGRSEPRSRVIYDRC